VCSSQLYVRIVTPFFSNDEQSRSSIKRLYSTVGGTVLGSASLMSLMSLMESNESMWKHAMVGRDDGLEGRDRLEDAPPCVYRR